MTTSEDEDLIHHWAEHLHWPSLDDAEHLARVVKHHFYHYTHVVAHLAYYLFSYLEGHGLEAYICGGLFLLTTYGVTKGFDV